MGQIRTLQFTGQIPMAGYRGTPTDAAGNPMASFGQAQASHDRLGRGQSRTGAGHDS